MKIIVGLAVTLIFVIPLCAQEIRIGIIGLDTSHAVAFTKIINDPSDPEHVPGGRVVAAYKGGSPDVTASATRVDKFTAELRDHYGIRLVGDIPSLCELVDAVLLESVDGRVHLQQAREMFRAHKRVFIDKPLAASLADARKIAQVARESHTPWFSSSDVRFDPAVRNLLTDPRVGRLLGATAFGRAPLEPTNPGLFWYGIHAVEELYTAMGPGCEAVTSTSDEDYDLVVGKWKDGRIGTVRAIRKGKDDFGLLAFGEHAVRLSDPLADSYAPLIKQIMRFFQTGVPPVANVETLEIMAFMDAAERSRAHGGVPVKLDTTDR